MEAGEMKWMEAREVGGGGGGWGGVGGWSLGVTSVLEMGIYLTWRH